MFITSIRCDLKKFKKYIFSKNKGKKEKKKGKKFSLHTMNLHDIYTMPFFCRKDKIWRIYYSSALESNIILRFLINVLWNIACFHAQEEKKKYFNEITILLIFEDRENYWFLIEFKFCICINLNCANKHLICQ